MKTISNFMKENKGISAIIVILVLFLGGLFGYKELSKNPEVVTRFGGYGEATSKETVKKVNKTSKLGKELPTVEEILSAYSSALTEQSDLFIDEYIMNTYGDDVYVLYTAGLIPSTSLSERENLILTLTGNVVVDKEDSYYGIDTFKQTFDYISEIGDSSFYVNSNPTREDWDYTLPSNNTFSNISTTLESKNFFVQGSYISKGKDMEDYQKHIIAETLISGEPQEFETDEEVEEEINRLVEHHATLTVPFVLKKDMKVSEIKKELSKMKLNDAELTFETSNENFKRMQGDVGKLELDHGNDYEVSGYSVLTATFILDGNTTLYSGTNFLSYGKNQMELTETNQESTKAIVWDNFNLGED